jgi:hypothetical protein
LLPLPYWVIGGGVRCTRLIQLATIIGAVMISCTDPAILLPVVVVREGPCSCPRVRRRGDKRRITGQAPLGRICAQSATPRRKLWSTGLPAFVPGVTGLKAPHARRGTFASVEARCPAKTAAEEAAATQLANNFICGGCTASDPPAGPIPRCRRCLGIIE